MPVFTDAGRKSVSATFNGTGPGPSILIDKNERYTVSVSGGSGIVDLERSFDDGVTWKVVEQIASPGEKDGIAAETMLVRLNCSAFTSGPISGRIGK